MNPPRHCPFLSLFSFPHNIIVSFKAFDSLLKCTTLSVWDNVSCKATNNNNIMSLIINSLSNFYSFVLYYYLVHYGWTGFNRGYIFSAWQQCYYNNRSNNEYKRASDNATRPWVSQKRVPTAWFMGIPSRVAFHRWFILQRCPLQISFGPNNIREKPLTGSLYFISKMLTYELNP